MPQGSVYADDECKKKWYPRCKDQGKLNLELSKERSDEDEHSEISTYEEIEESIKKLKNGKAPSEENIVPEMIKYGGKQLAKKLQELICAIWREEKVPADWETGIICPYLKKVINLTATTTEALHYWI
jgi:hypothetical protein